MDQINKKQDLNTRLFFSHAHRDSEHADRIWRTAHNLWSSQSNELDRAIYLWSRMHEADSPNLWWSRLNVHTGLDTASRRAQRAIDSLVADGLIDVSVAERARTLVHLLFTPNTIYASIAPDDGGITFYWRAGDMSIEIDIYPAEGFWWKVRNVATENFSGHGSELPVEALKHSLTWFSKEVDRVNPHWRSQTV